MGIVRKIKPFFTDERGSLSHLLEDEKGITSAVLIVCNKGAVRANHYHKKDTHHSYMLKGKMEYYYKDLRDKKAKLQKIIVKEGEIVTTPPNTLHAMKFLENSVFIALTTESRKQEEYEADTVRVKVV